MGSEFSPAPLRLYFAFRFPNSAFFMYAVLHIADFALQAVLRAERDVAAHPAALFSENTRRSVVLAANPRARTGGVRVDMTAPQAVARCPALLIRTPNASAEAEARATLLTVALTLSPAIEDTAPGVCTIDLRGGSPAQYERGTRLAIEQLRAFGLQATAGIAPTPQLGMYAARSIEPPAPDTEPGQTELALGESAAPYPHEAPASSAISIPIAEPLRTPFVRVVTDTEAFLSPLPLSTAEPSPGTADVLRSWGLRTLGDLTALSRDDVGRRLGPEGLALWNRARGGEARPLRRVASTQTFAAAMDFEDEIETLEPLLFILRRFLDRLTFELRTAGFVAADLDLRLRLVDGTTYHRNFRLPDPTADVEILFRALHTHLESLRTDTPIVGIELRIDPARPLVRQHGLFDTGLRDPHGFSETLARVAAIVGDERVGTPIVLDTHRPDAATLHPPAAVIAPALPHPVHPPVGLPLRRFRPPLPAQLELVEGRPTYLWTERFQGTVAEIRGPWQSSGDWWQANRAWRRTEYDIALAGGGLYRLVLVDCQWLIEGEYD